MTNQLLLAMSVTMKPSIKHDQLYREHGMSHASARIILSSNGGASELGCQHLVRVGVIRERVQNDTTGQPRDGVLSTVNDEK